MNNKKQTNKIVKKTEDLYSYDIDYDIFTTEEIIKIINFYNLTIKYTKHKVKYDDFINSYNEYRNIINSIAMEKRYNKSFYEKTGISIYHLVNNH